MFFLICKLKIATCLFCNITYNIYIDIMITWALFNFIILVNVVWNICVRYEFLGVIVLYYGSYVYSYEKLTKFLGNSYKKLTKILTKFAQNVYENSYEIFTKILTKFLWNSLEILMKFLKSSYEIRKNASSNCLKKRKKDY